MKAWMLLAAEWREYGGNAGYDDSIESKYEFDSNVPNCKQLAEGDFVVVRDKKKVLGSAIITTIKEYQGVTKVISRCPICDFTGIKERKNKIPRWRCGKGHEFESPSNSEVLVTRYVAEFSDSFRGNSNNVLLDEVRAITLKSAKQLSIQGLDLDMAKSLFGADISSAGLDPMVGEDEEGQSAVAPVISGVDQRQAQIRLIKLRRGQTKFRNALISRYGHNCAVSGPTSLHVLEAAHIIPYRGDDTNHVENGILLRADLHTLFDLGLVRISSSPISVIVSEDLRDTVYWNYHGKVIFNDASIRPSSACLAERWRTSV
jgi:putative restriction endonuclease